MRYWQLIPRHLLTNHAAARSVWTDPQYPDRFARNLRKHRDSHLLGPARLQRLIQLHHDHQLRVVGRQEPDETGDAGAQDVALRRWDFGGTRFPGTLLAVSYTHLTL